MSGSCPIFALKSESLYLCHRALRPDEHEEIVVNRFNGGLLFSQDTELIECAADASQTIPRNRETVLFNKILSGWRRG